jgi:serine/threonine-protein kinase
VPAVLPVGVAAPTMAMSAEAAATTVMPAQGAGFETTLLGVSPNGGAGAGGAQRTTLLDAPTGAYPVTTETAVDDRPRRPRWTWPLIALILLIVLAVLAWAIPHLIPTSSTAKASTTPKTVASASAKPSATKTAAASTVTVNGSDYLGLQYQDAVSKLQNAGLVGAAQKGKIASSADQVGQVYAISPTGNVQSGSTVTVTYYTSAANPAKPQAAPTLSDPSSQPVPAGSTITVSWPRYNSCPAGTSLSGYQAFVSGAGVASGSSGQQPVSKSTTDLQIPTSSSGGPVNVKYEVFCGSQNSDYSPTLTVQVAPQSQPSSTPSATGTTPASPAPSDSASPGLQIGG